MISRTARLRAALPRVRALTLGRIAGGFRFSGADGLMIVTMLIWSINITSVKVVVGAIPPLGFGVLRYGLATCMLFAILRWREGSVGIPWADVGWVALGGAVSFGLNQIGFLLGIRLTSASLAAIILATAPLLAAALAALWAWEPVRRRTLLALMVSFAGVLVVIAGSGLRLSSSWLGGLLILFAAATLALGAILAKRPLQRASSLRVTTWMALFGCLTLLPFGLPALLTMPRTAITPVIVLAAGFTVLGSTVLGNLIWNYAIQQIGAARTTAYTYLQPVMGVAGAVILLGERLSALQLTGGLVVLIGLLLYPRQRRPTTAASE